jgi:phosphotriesterase-related protein
MKVTTVLGEVDAADLGPTLPHEHLFIDLRNQFRQFSDPEKRRRSAETVQLANVGVLRRNPYALKDNLVVDDVELCVGELERLRALGGRTIVDCTSIGLGRAPLRLKDVALRTGLNIVAGCGYYTQDTHPPEMSSTPVETIAEQMVSDLTQGIDGSDVRAGVIGEIGTGHPFHPDEQKAVLAAALAFREVPAAIHVHTYPWSRHATEAVDLLVRNGVEPGKVVINHLDVAPDLVYIKAVLDRGAIVEFDCFGKEFYIDSGEEAFAEGRFITDLERVQLINQLLGWGYATQLLITNDLCFKTMLCAYGGWGYGHIFEHVVPMLRDHGIDQQVIDTIVVENPARVLAI